MDPKIFQWYIGAKVWYIYPKLNGGFQMQLIVKTKKVGEMTTIELKNLIKDTLFEGIDPDYGLELRTEVEKELRESRKQKKSGKGVSLKDAKKHLGLA